jgi:hypothetical protein
MISIDETCSIQKKLSNIKHIQKRYLKKWFFPIEFI